MGVRLSFASLLVADPDASVEFYRDVFDLDEVTDLASPHFRGLWVEGTVLGFSGPHAYELLALPVPPDGETGVDTFLTFEAEDRAAVDALTERAVAHGGTVLAGPAETYYGAWQSVVRDPDGHVLRVNFLPL
ncbi:VOC family protein [Modestobacter sp. Leaf380]|uniref:VOC family protein n=1 Tax=Modestobacter sp. Leaf380 TaxID=1736356 RepID=UPI0006FE5F43|nr:VOC family protein [Modestobacter sp. Leaf380]KQS66756.1 hypothetical protein ASG41_09995 [Modestobacter sp. Leaf380]